MTHTPDAKTQGLPEMISLIALAVIGYDCPPDELDAEHLFLKDRRQLDKLIPLIREELLGSELVKALEEVITKAKIWYCMEAGRVLGQGYTWLELIERFKDRPEFAGEVKRWDAALNELKGQTP